MTRRTFVMFFAIVVVSISSSDSKARTWTDRKGRTVEANYVAFNDGKVRINRISDGKVFDVPLESLIDADQAFVQTQVKTNRQPPTVADKTLPQHKWWVLSVDIQKLGSGYMVGHVIASRQM
ncbi:MAG: SHD1 domain-containing protein [Planctomycetota bacterium]|nr:SHD1 domain-containing protein [Planctomycetota bacterium]